MPGPYRVSAFTEGWSSNVTVLSVPDGSGGVRVYVDRPSHKAIAIAELGIGTAKSAGNDWSRPWPPGAATALVEAAVRIGEWAWAEHRMAGLFGLDAILTPGGEVRVNEVNCRNQGTTEVSSVNQQLRGQPPFVIAHLVTMLGGRVDWLGDPSEYNHETIRRAMQPGAGPFYAKVRLGGQGPVRISPDFPGPGVYRLDEAGRLHLIRGGAHPADADADRGEVLIASAPARMSPAIPVPRSRLLKVSPAARAGRLPPLGPRPVRPCGSPALFSTCSRPFQKDRQLSATGLADVAHAIATVADERGLHLAGGRAHRPGVLFP